MNENTLDLTLSRTRRFSSAASICGTPDSRNILPFLVYCLRSLLVRNAGITKEINYLFFGLSLVSLRTTHRFLSIWSVPCVLSSRMKCQTTQNVFFPELYKLMCRLFVKLKCERLLKLFKWNDSLKVLGKLELFIFFIGFVVRCFDVAVAPCWDITVLSTHVALGKRSLSGCFASDETIEIQFLNRKIVNKYWSMELLSTSIAHSFTTKNDEFNWIYNIFDQHTKSIGSTCTHEWNAMILWIELILLNGINWKWHDFHKWLLLKYHATKSVNDTNICVVILCLYLVTIAANGIGHVLPLQIETIDIILSSLNKVVISIRQVINNTKIYSMYRYVYTTHLYNYISQSDGNLLLMLIIFFPIFVSVRFHSFFLCGRWHRKWAIMKHA